ncbi:MAG: hypothetical protein WA707_05430, partial [Pseudolabrys sp.]
MRFRKTAFLSFALSQAPGQLQRHGHFIIVFAQESDPGLIDAAPDHARAERALFARKERNHAAKESARPVSRHSDINKPRLQLGEQ